MSYSEALAAFIDQHGHSEEWSPEEQNGFRVFTDTNVVSDDLIVLASTYRQSDLMLG